VHPSFLRTPRSYTMAQTTITEMANPSFLMRRVNETAIEDRPVPDESASVRAIPDTLP
jgi:hypothetical protein